MDSQYKSEFPCPYIGLEPFTEENAAFFFGREKSEEEIKQKLVASPLTFLCGASGVGKSSLLNAGLFYHLRQQAKENCEESGMPGFGIIFFKAWSTDPLLGLIGRIQESINDLLIDKSRCNWPADLTLANTLQLGMYRVGGSLLIILDQFEDYFAYKHRTDKKGNFFNQLLDVMKNHDLKVNFLISIREESFSKLDIFRGHISGSLFDNYSRLEHLDKNIIEILIKKPIEKYNEIQRSKYFYEQQEEMPEPALVEVISNSKNLLSDDGSGIETSYLQLVMKRLWDELWDENNKRNSYTLSLKLLEELNGVEAIIKNHVERAISDLTSPQQDIAAHIFQYLAPPSGRIAYSINDLSYQLDQEQYGLQLTQAEIHSLLEELSKKRILREKTPAYKKNSENLDDKYYEIFHDKLTNIIQDWRAQYLRKIENRLHIIKQSLPSQALRQLKQGQQELAALLAYQAYRFNQEDKRRDNLDILDQVDEALREVLSQHFSCVLQKNEGEAASVAFNSDGTLLAVGSNDGNVRLWHLDRRHLDRLSDKREILPGDAQRGIHSLAFSSDDQYLAAGCWVDKNCSDRFFLRVWNLSENPPSSRILQSSSGHWCMVGGVIFNPKQSNILVSCGDDGRVLLWDLGKSNEEVFVIEDRPTDNPDKYIRDNWVKSVAFNQDGDLLASGGKHGLIRLWHINGTNRSLATEFYHEGSEGSDSELSVLYVAFHPSNPRTLVTAGDSKTVCIWDLSQLAQPKCIKILSGHVGFVSSVAFSPDGKVLASASEDQTIRLWDLSQHDVPLIATLYGHYFGVNSIAFSPKGKLVLASGSWDQTVRLWELSQPIAEPRVFEGHQGNVSTVTFVSDEELVSGSWDNTVRLWDINNIDKPLKVFQGHTDKVFSVTFYCSEDKQIQLIASAGQDNDSTVRIWNLCQPEAKPCILYHPFDAGVSCVAFSPDGRLLASGSKNRGVKLWNSNRFDDRDTPDFGGHWKHQKSVTSVAFSPNGKLLASGSDDQTVRLWRVEDPYNWYPIHCWKAHDQRIWSVAFSPNGEILASGSDDQTIRLWNIIKHDESQLIATLRGHNYWVSSVAFNQDGTKLASGSYDGTIRLWDISKPDMVPSPIMLSGHSQRICSVAFSPNGKLLASASFDDTIRLWRIETDFLAEEVSKKIFRDLSEEEWQKFIGTDIAYPYNESTLSLISNK